MRTLTIFLGLCLAAASFSCGGGSSAATHTTVQPPVSPASLSVSNVSADVLSNNSVVITWTTSLGSTSQVEYGWSASYGSMTPLDSTAVVNHSVTPSGLSPGMSYHYRVHSTDGSDQAVRGDQSFSTPAAASASAPLCSNPQTGKVLSATPSLFQGSGRITFHDNVLVDGQYAAAVFENQDLPLELAYIYNNTVYTTQSGIYFGSAASTADAVVGNLVFAATPISGPIAHPANNITDTFTNAGKLRELTFLHSWFHELLSSARQGTGNGSGPFCFRQQCGLRCRFQSQFKGHIYFSRCLCRRRNESRLATPS